MSSKLIIGCGYLGSRVGRRWLDAGHVVHAVTRSAERAAALAAAGYAPIVADVTDRASLAALPAAETVLFAVGFDRRGDKTIEQVYVDGFRNTLDALSSKTGPPNTGRLIYISTTGVYSQDDGSTIDEDSPCRPTRPGGRASLAAEQLLAGHPRASNAAILRLAGIYGPGRVPRRDDLIAGVPIAADGDSFLNLIHVDDAARVVVEAARREGSLRLYLVSDGTPVRRAEYYAELARRWQTPPPVFAPLDDPSASRRGTDKRISSRRMLEELGIALEYPSYRKGLASL